MTNKYYVYVYLDTRKPGNYNYGELKFNYLPFYVGKGKRNRYREHLINAYKNYDKKGKDNNSHKCGTIRHIKEQTGSDPLILIIKHFDDELESLNYEKFIIENIGRTHLKNGPLTNLTEGGCGATITDETKRKLSELNKGKYNSNYIQLDKNVIDKIIHLYCNEDMRMKDIGKVMEINENKIKRTLKENGIVLKKRKPPINFIPLKKGELELIKFLYNNQISIRDISKQLKLPFEKIRNIIKQNNLTRTNGFIRNKTHLQNQSNARKGKYKGKKSWNYKQLSELELDKIIYLRQDLKYTYKQITEEMKNYSVAKIINVLRELNLIKCKSD